MKAGNDIAVFDVGEAAEMENEIGPAPLDGDFVAGFFHISIGEPHVFPDLSET